MELRPLCLIAFLSFDRDFNEYFFRLEILDFFSMLLLSWLSCLFIVPRFKWKEEATLPRRPRCSPQPRLEINCLIYIEKYKYFGAVERVDAETNLRYLNNIANDPQEWERWRQQCVVRRHIIIIIIIITTRYY